MKYGMDMVVTERDIIAALNDVGIRRGDVVIVHSSLKSMGYVEGGADTVIDALLKVLGGLVASILFLALYTLVLLQIIGYAGR